MELLYLSDFSHNHSSRLFNYACILSSGLNDTIRQSHSSKKTPPGGSNKSAIASTLTYTQTQEFTPELSLYPSPYPEQKTACSGLMVLTYNVNIVCPFRTIVPIAKEGKMEDKRRDSKKSRQFGFVELLIECCTMQSIPGFTCTLLPHHPFGLRYGQRNLGIVFVGNGATEESLRGFVLLICLE